MPLYAHQPGMIAGYSTASTTPSASALPPGDCGRDDRSTDDASHRREPGSEIAALSGARQARVNSSHHQSIDRPGRNLRAAARSADGVVEAVEYTGDHPWLAGVQWHPERMAEDGLSKGLFRELVAAARGQRHEPRRLILRAANGILERFTKKSNPGGAPFAVKGADFF